MPRKNKEMPVKRGRGQPLKYGQACVQVSVSMPPELEKRLDCASEQTGQSRSAIVVAGLRAILSQTPDRLREQIGG
jgi:metal-responsive CopG/Arc/MetJ family transcriptional regulator